MRWAAAMLLFAASCGDGDFFRPLALEIEGLSGRADTLIVKVFPASTGQTCSGVDLTTAAALQAPHTLEWRRADMRERRLELDTRIEEDRVTLVAYSLCNGAQTIQFTCKQITFEQIGEERLGVVFISLSRRTEPCSPG